jgi:beta-alanine degradation protein BauB
MSAIATKKIFENDKIAVWEMVLEPGESTGIHTHPHDYVFYVIEGSTSEITDKNGKFLGKLEMLAGDSMFIRCEGQELVAGDLRLPATHNARNVGTTRYREILVETK